MPFKPAAVTRDALSEKRWSVFCLYGVVVGKCFGFDNDNKPHKQLSDYI